MRKAQKISIVAALICAMLLPPLAVNAPVANAAVISTTATGYTKAEDVKYVEKSGYRCNWGARDEDCVFLSKYAQAFYTGNNVYDTLSQKSGGTTQSNASQSALYSSLKSLMAGKHKTQTGYQATRDMYKYTDCVSSDYNHISSFYSGKVLNGAWDSGSTWNREHTWPDSKGLGGNDENDIIMLRPTAVSENSSRGNMAYGEGGGSFYDPGESVRGDCARIVLYVYTRWGNTNNMWGAGGVMKDKETLLRWMEEDPVDTWEMGRNDSTEEITGTRNVFVDYPEYAWLLFGEEIPNDMSTPSGIAKNPDGTPPVDSSSSLEDSSSMDSSLEDSSIEDSSSDSSVEENSSTVEDSSSQEQVDSSKPDDRPECEHESENWLVLKPATETEEGEQMGYCFKCGNTVTVKIPALGSTNDSEDTGEDIGEHEVDNWMILKAPTQTEKGQKMGTCKKCGETLVIDIPMLPTIDEETSDCDSSIQNGFGVLTALAIASVVLMKKKENYIEE